MYFRIRELKFSEPFPSDSSDLYHGDYLIDFAKNIISSNSSLNFENYENIHDELTKLSIEINDFLEKLCFKPFSLSIRF